MTSDRTPITLSGDLERELHEQAKASGIALPVMVDQVLRQFVQQQKPGDPAKEERRAACRRKISVPAVVHTLAQDGRTGRYRVAQLQDISVTGIGLRFESTEREHFKEGREFEVLFQLGDHSSPLRMACKACRKVLDEAGVVIGAVFKESLPDLHEQISTFA